MKSCTMANMHHIASKDHDGLIKKKVKKFRKSNFLTDLHIICQNGSVSIHKILLLQKLPRLADFLCEFCDLHSDTTFILPEVAREDIEREVKNLYSFGIVSGLEDLFGVGDHIIGNRIKIENETHDLHKDLNISNELTDLPMDNVSEETEEKDSFESNSSDTLDELEKGDANMKTNKAVVKLDVKDVQEVEDHTFEILQGQSSTNPGILLVDNLFKYFNNSTSSSKFGQHFHYMCSFMKKTKCRASATLVRDHAGLVVMVKCANDDDHNHEASEAKIIAKKMQKGMVDMIKVGLYGKYLDILEYK